MKYLRYDLAASRLTDPAMPPQLRFSPTAENWVIELLGELPAGIVNWSASVAKDHRSRECDVLARSSAIVYDSAANSVTISLDSFTETFLAYVDGQKGGRPAFFALRGFGNGDDELFYMEFNIQVVPAVDPPGSYPQPPPVTAADVRSVNGLRGDVELVDQDGEKFETVDNRVVIPIYKPAVPAVYWVPYATIGTAAVDAVGLWTLAGHGLAVGDIVSPFNLTGGATSMRDGSGYYVTAVSGDTFSLVWAGASAVYTPSGVGAADICKCNVSSLSIPTPVAAPSWTAWISGDVINNYGNTATTTTYFRVYPVAGCSRLIVGSFGTLRPDQPAAWWSSWAPTSATQNLVVYPQLGLRCVPHEVRMTIQLDGENYLNGPPIPLAVNNDASGSLVQRSSNRQAGWLEALPGMTIELSRMTFDATLMVLARNFEITIVEDK